MSAAYCYTATPYSLEFCQRGKCSFYFFHLTGYYVFLNSLCLAKLHELMCGVYAQRKLQAEKPWLFGSGLRSFVFFNILIAAVCALRFADNCALTWCGCNSLPCFAFGVLAFLPLVVAFLVCFFAVLAMILISCYLVCYQLIRADFIFLIPVIENWCLTFDVMPSA